MEDGERKRERGGEGEGEGGEGEGEGEREGGREEEVITKLITSTKHKTNNFPHTHTLQKQQDKIIKTTPPPHPQMTGYIY